MQYVTYENMFTFTVVIISVITLILNIQNKQKNNRPVLEKQAVIF